VKSTHLALAAAALAILASESAFALRCGDVLYQSVTLSGDVICAPTEDGLIVGADGVRVDLNGFTIQGSTSSIWATTGIMSLNHSGTEIVGPGRIQDFNATIVLRDGGKHRVSGVTAFRGEVSLINVSDSVVEGSELSRLSVGTAAGGKAYWNRVEDNDFFPAPNPNPNIIDTSIQLAGCGTEKNVVTGNRMAAPSPKGPPGFGLMIFGNASNNQVTRNTFTRTVFLGGGALGNEVSGNVITATAQPGMAGVEIQTMGSSCLRGGWMGASNNVIRENEITDGEYGVAFRSLPGASNFGNEIRGNKISARNAGLAFSTWSDNNDGRQNRVNAPVYAIDFGAGNLWP
jgi:hypothetical protein